MKTFKVYGEPPTDTREFDEVEADDAEDAARIYVHERYEQGWSDSFPLWVQDEDGRTVRLEINTRFEFIVDVRPSRSKGGAK